MKHNDTLKRIGIVNRGEPAVRFLNALGALQRQDPDAPESVFLYTDADAGSSAIRRADHAVRIGLGRLAYLDAEAVIAGLLEGGCDAAWLGWGFASEDGVFAQALVDAGITLLGPRPETMLALGDKIRSKQLAELHGIPVAPWAVAQTAAEAVEAARRIGFPLLIKAAGGGGGRGIRRVDHIDAVGEAFVTAGDEAARSFGGGGVFLERLVPHARHIEVQVLGDGEGDVHIVGVRDCSLQRRRQKVIEECPAPHLPAEQFEVLCASARRLCSAVRYRSAGTVEFLYDLDRREPYFLEVNTRLQVEHPITEEVHGIDLVRAQIEIARTGRLPAPPQSPRGWAVEARICAEDTRQAFTPTPGPLVRFALPTGPGLRVDTGFDEGDAISAEFDPLIAKLIAWGPDRPTAFARLSQALDESRIVIEGGTTNLAFLRALARHPDVLSGEVDTGLIERWAEPAPPGRGAAVLAAAIDRFLADGDMIDTPTRHRVEAGATLTVHRLGRGRYRVASDAGAVTVRYGADGPHQMRLDTDTDRYCIERAPGDARYLVDGVSHAVAAAGGGAVTAPSAALVLAMPVRPGDRVEAGQTVAILESMKMEVRIDAVLGGTVGEVGVEPGDQVTGGQLLVVVESDDAEQSSAPEADDVAWAEDTADGAADRVRAALIGWDFDPETLLTDAHRVEGAAIVDLLSAFADVAEFFERRPTRPRDGGHGAAGAVATDIWMHTLRSRGAAALAPDRAERLRAVLAHHGVDDLEPGPGLDEALLRVRRAGAALASTREAAIALIDTLQTPERRLLDRLAALDPERFDRVAEAADRARYTLVELPAHRALLERAATRSAALFARLRDGQAGWPEIIAAPESLVPGFAPHAAEGCPLAAEAVARRLECGLAGWPIARIALGDHLAFEIDRGETPVICATTTPSALPSLLSSARHLGPMRRLTVVTVAEHEATSQGVLDRVIAGLPRESRMPWLELCLIGVAPGDRIAVRRFHGDGTERTDRRDVMPSTARRLDLDRLSGFDLERQPSPDDVVLFRARAKDNPDDVRLMVFGEVRSAERAPGHPLRLPHVERVFHAAVRAIDSARQQLDVRRRMQWNRIMLRIVPPVPLPLPLISDYIERLAPSALGIGLEKVVVRARCVDPQAKGGVGPLTDLAITVRPGSRQLDMAQKPASSAALVPQTPYEARVVRARRRGLTHPYEIVRLLESSPTLPAGHFVEYDLDTDGACIPVPDRARGGNTAGVVFGVMTSEGGALPQSTARVLLLSDPTMHMGALAEPECRRVVAAIDLADEMGLPVEWVAVSAGARIDWDSGTENLDWTARVLARIVRFTQAGGQIDVIVPGICVGAQSYWNAEATMMMHTRGVLVMTDRGTMVLTGKRALDASGCVSAEDDLALGGYTAIMGPNGQAQAHAVDLADAYQLLYRYHALTHVAPGAHRPARVATTDPIDRDVSHSPYPAHLEHGFDTVGDLFSMAHNPDRKRPFAVRPVMAALSDADQTPVERWAGMHEAETVVVWETRIGGHSAVLLGISNQPMSRLGERTDHGPDVFAGGTLYPQGARKLARALNAASGRRPAVILANLSGFDGSPESLRQWQLEYGAEIGRAVVNFDGPIAFVVLSRYHGGAYVVFSKQLNPQLTSLAIEGSYASVIGGAPAASVVFAREVRQRAAELGGDDRARARAHAELAERFDGIHTVGRAREVGSIDDVVSPARLRPAIIELLARDFEAMATGR